MTFSNQIPYSIVNNILLLGFLWVGLKFIELTFKPKANSLFLLAVIAQFSSCTIFILSFFNYRIIPFNDANGIFNLTLNTTDSILVYVVYFYFVGLFIYLVRFIFHLYQVHHLKISGDFTTHAKWLNLLSSSNLKLPKQIKIGLSDKINTPMVFGYFEPIVLMPISICNNLSNEEIKLILIHEIAHILRNDFIINIFVKLTAIVLWFNPFSYLLLQKINLLREIACDELVMECNNAPVEYSKALYLIANADNTSMSSQMIGATNGNNNHLLIRIKRINNISNENRYSKAIVSFLLIVSGCISSFLLTHGKINKPNEQVKQYTFKSNSNIAKKSYLAPVQNTFKSKKPIKHISQNLSVANAISINEKSVNNSNYDELINETKLWIKQHQNPILYAGYSNIQDSVDNLVAERLLMSSIIRSYQLKRAVMEQRLSNAKDMTEVVDYYMHSKEWDDIAEYEKWANEYLGRHQQDTSLFPATTKQQIQYR